MTENINEIKSLLKSTSIKAFIKYYTKFQENLEEKNFTEQFKINEKWNESSYKTIISSGKKIFANDLNEIALIYILSLDKRIEKETIERANELLKEIEYKREKTNKHINANLLTNEEIYWDLKDYQDEKKIINGH